MVDVETLRVVAGTVVDEGTLVLLGRGGFAATFLVQKPDGQEFALKVIDQTQIDVDRFERELGALRRVDDPHVVRLIDSGTCDYNGCYYNWISMEYIEGQSLMELFSSGTNLSLLDAVELCSQLLSGITALWDNQLAHRDLSPNNVMIDQNGHIRIIDLGMSRHATDETITEFLPGTPGWMSPEQVRDRRGDWRSDQFVIGLLFYSLLTGRHPYLGKAGQSLWTAPIDVQIDPLERWRPDAPLGLRVLIKRLTERQVYKRYPRATSIAQDLAKIKDDLQLIGQEQEDECSMRSPEFFVRLGQQISFLDDEFLFRSGLQGVIIPPAKIPKFSSLPEECPQRHLMRVFDPSTHGIRSKPSLRDKSLSKYTSYGNLEASAPMHPGTRSELVQGVLGCATSIEAQVVIAPYFSAAPDESEWLAESDECYRETLYQIAGSSVEGSITVWRGLDINQRWLTSPVHRDELLARVTSYPDAPLCLFVETTQDSFATLADRDVLLGLRELMDVAREVDMKIHFPRRASSGLLLISMGAASWSVGVEAKYMNIARHAEEESGRGGPSVDRLFVPSLLTMIRLDDLSRFPEEVRERLFGATSYGEILLSNDILSKGTEITTEDRLNLHRHNVMVERAMAVELSDLPVSGRIAKMLTWLDVAQDTAKALPELSDSLAFLGVWRELLT